MKKQQLLLSTNDSSAASDRLLSLDFFRGVVMLLLAGEAALVYHTMIGPGFTGTWLAILGSQFHHAEWQGLRFWDLIQPAFMFIVGVSMPFSFQKRLQRGVDWRKSFGYVLKRSALLLLFGVSLHIYYSQSLVFEYWNVLSQLSFTYLLAFLVMRSPWLMQIAFSISLLVVTELLYRQFGVPGFDQPFTPDQNFGSWFDLWVMGKLSGGHWVIFNAVPTAAHTIWGVLAGQLLLSHRADIYKVTVLVIVGTLCVLVGYGLDAVTPIIKRAVTSSFTIVSGGWVLLFLGVSYWVIDARKLRKGIMIPIVVGMNSIFIYLFFEFGGATFIRSIIGPFSRAAFSWAGDDIAGLGTSLITWAALWYLCFWLYQRRIFFKI